MKEITYVQASIEALQEEFRRDKRYIYMGTMVPDALRREFGEERIRETPISESAFAGAAIGLAGSGFRPVVNMGMATFAFVAMDQFVNQAAKITYMFGGQAKFPIVYMMVIGAGRYMAAQHQISPYAMYMNVPGLKIALPSTPYDVKGLLRTALRDNNPVIFFPHVSLSDIKGQIPEEEYSIAFGQANIRKKGSDVTVVALSRMTYEALAAAEEMNKQGVSVEVIDPCTLVPLDIKSIRDSVAKTGRLIVVDEACPACSVASEIVSLVVQDSQTFACMKSAPKIVTGRNIPIPYSPPMEKYAVPDLGRIKAAIETVMSLPPLKPQLS